MHERVASHPAPMNTQQRGQSRSVEIQPGSPRGCDLLATYASYADAQAAVDWLSDAEFPVENTSIVVRDLIFVEQVTGRLTWPRVLGSGLVNGGLIGIFVGVFFGIFLINPFAWGSMLLWSCAAGAATGALIALAGHWATGGKRDFDSVGSMKGGRYELYVVREFIDEARTILDGLDRPQTAKTNTGPGVPR